MKTIDLVPAGERSEALLIDHVIRPDPLSLYGRRAERLRELAVGHPEAAYLEFAAEVCTAQQEIFVTLPQANAAPCITRADALSPNELLAQSCWQEALTKLVQAMPVAAPLATNEPARLARQARSLLQGRFGNVGQRESVFLWAALSLQWSHVAAHVASLHDPRGPAQTRFDCPTCGSAPSASIILGGKRGGLRYLHCPLCETRWHLVRAVCSCCGGADEVEYWSVDEARAVVKLETCRDCQGYLKVCFADIDARADPVADDLASLHLDYEAERMGFLRTGINPFAFPANGP